MAALRTIVAGWGVAPHSPGYEPSESLSLSPTKVVLQLFGAFVNHDDAVHACFTAAANRQKAHQTLCKALAATRTPNLPGRRGGHRP